MIDHRGFSHFFYHFAPRGEWQNGVKRPTIPMGTGPSELSGDLFNYLPQVFNGPRVGKNRKKIESFLISVTFQWEI